LVVDARRGLGRAGARSRFSTNCLFERPAEIITSWMLHYLMSDP
jgi:hypothetical protein